MTFSGAIAFLAVGFNGFMSFFFPVLGSKEAIFSLAVPGFPINVTVGTLFSMIVVLLISGLHCLGVRLGTATQNILTTLKIGSLLGIILLGVLFGKGDTAHFSPFFDWEKIGNFSVFAAAFIPAIFAYSGWNAVIYIAGEVKDPERNLPRALLCGKSHSDRALSGGQCRLYLRRARDRDERGAQSVRGSDDGSVRLPDIGVDHRASSRCRSSAL